MTTLLRTRIIKIGNSQGVRIPKALLDQARLPDDVEMEASSEQIVIRPARRVRQDWAEHFQRMAVDGDDALLDVSSPSLSAWDDEEWEWQ